MEDHKLCSYLQVQRKHDGEDQDWLFSPRQSSQDLNLRQQSVPQDKPNKITISDFLGESGT